MGNYRVLKLAFSGFLEEDLQTLLDKFFEPLTGPEGIKAGDLLRFLDGDKRAGRNLQHVLKTGKSVQSGLTIYLTHRQFAGKSPRRQEVVIELPFISEFRLSYLRRPTRRPGTPRLGSWEVKIKHIFVSTILIVPLARLVWEYKRTKNPIFNGVTLQEVGDLDIADLHPSKGGLQ